MSVAKTVEIMMERDGSSDQLLHPPDLRPLVDEEKQAIVLMSSFCPQQSTPDPAVGTALANGTCLSTQNTNGSLMARGVWHAFGRHGKNPCVLKFPSYSRIAVPHLCPPSGFSRCMPNSAPPVLTRSGVVPGNEAFLPHCGIEGFVSEGVIRTVVFKNAEEYHTVVARCRRLNFDDLMKVVSKTVLEQEKAVNLIKWWTRFSQVDALNRSVVQTRGIALKEAIRFYPQSDKERATALLIENGASKPAITKLNELLFYAETNSPFARRDMPLPDTVIPGPLQDAIGMTALTSDVLNYSWFSPFPIELFAECMGHHSCLNDAQPEDDLLRVKVLTVLCREYMRRQGSEREVFGGLCHSILSNRRCLPFDSDQPTLFAADFPTDLYLYSAELKAFDGVGSFYKVARSLQVAGVTDEFLLTLGVRKSVSIDFLFSHLDTLNWSRNPMALIEYLRSATLTRSDLHKLSTTKYLPATNDNSTTYAPGELYLPNKDLHVFPFIRMLQWPESEVSESSENGKFLRRLGIKTMPSLVQVLSFLSDENSSDDQRVKALDFVSDRLVPNGIYYNSYSSMALSEKKKYRFLPCVVQFPFEAVTSLHQRQSPVSCFSEKSCAVMGFPVIDPQLGKQGLLYGTIFQCEPEPQASYLLNQLAHLVAVAKDKLKSTSKKDQNEVGQCIEATFHKIFQYLSHRSADLNYSTFETLARESFIPCLKNDMMRWHRPDEVFFKRVNRGNDTLTEELFHVIDFSPFLAAAGVKEDASTKEVFQKILQSPEDVLRALGSERKYRALLRRVAADPPFTLSRPSTGIKNCPFLLAYTVKPFSEQKSEKSESLVEDKLIYHLAKAEDIYIIDNSNYGRMFPVYRGPQETDLEDFYISLGSQYISKSVDRRCEVVGSPRTDTALTKALKDILRERGPLLVSPNVTSRPLVPGASSIIDEKRLECYEVTNLLAIYTLGKISRRSRTTCFSRPSANKKNAIFVTRDFDLFDVGQAIGDLILKRCQLEDAFFISSLLDTPLDQLRARGFPVDRILKAEPVVVPEEQKPEPQMVPQAPKRAPGASVPHLPTVAPLTTAEAAEASNGQKEAVPLKSFPPSPTSTDPSGPVKASGSNVAGGPPSATNSKADILMQMFPDAEPNFLQAALGHDPSVDDVKDLADKMVNGHYPRKNGSDSVTQAPSNSSVDDFNDEVTSAKKKSLRHRFGRAFGGKKGSSHGGAHLPFPSNQSKLGYSGGGYAAPLGANKSVEKRGPVSPAVDAQTQNSLERMLEQEVGKSNRVTKDDIDAPETNLTSIPPDLDRGETCEVIPGHSLEPFLGPRGNGLTHNGIFVFSSKEYASSETFLDENVESLRCFADVLERLCVDVFGLKLATIAIYHDPAGVSIAFNRNKVRHYDNNNCF